MYDQKGIIRKRNKDIKKIRLERGGPLSKVLTGKKRRG